MSNHGQVSQSTRGGGECQPALRVKRQHRVLFVAAADFSRFVYVSPAFDVLFGRPRESLLASAATWFESIHAEDRDRVARAIASVHAAQPCVTSFQIVRPDGTLHHVRCELAAASSAHGGATEVFGVVEELAEFSMAIDSLAASEHRLRTIINNTPSVAIEAFDVDGRVLMWNSAAERLFGWSESEAIGRTLDELILDAQATRDFVQLLRQIDRTGQPMGPMEWEYRRRGGGGGTLLSTLFPVTQDDGSPMYVCMDVDITDRKRAEAALQAAELLNHRIIEAMPGGVVYISADGQIYSANSGAAEILGLSFDELTSRFVRDYVGETFHEDGSPCGIDDYPVTVCLRTSRPAGPRTIGVRRRDGSMAWAIFTAIPIIDPASGQAISAVVTFLDITERKRFEQRQQLFIREMDHRIRNNLSSLLTLIDMSRRTAMSVDAFARSISGRVKAIAAVHSLIGDAPRRTLRNIIHAITPGDHIGKVQARGDHVSIPPRQVTPLAMVLHELMTNSLKHGCLHDPAGTVHIDWIVGGEADGASLVCLSWREAGVPIIGQPSDAGVGTQLIRGLVKAELRGTVELLYPREGACHRLMVTLDPADSLPERIEPARDGRTAPLATSQQ